MSEVQIIWLMGLSGSGKTTLATALAARLKARDQGNAVFDGDRLREGLCRDLGFGTEDRRENLRRAAHVARLVAESGLVSICAFITPLEAYRQMIRDIVAPHRILMVALDCPLDSCAQRDPKGLYRQQAQNGEISGLTGLGAPYEVPLSADLVLDTRVTPVDECLNLIEQQMR